MINVRRFPIRQLYSNHVKTWLKVCEVLLDKIKLSQLAQLCNFFCSYRQRRMWYTSAPACFNFTKYEKFLVFSDNVKLTQPTTVISLNYAVT